MRFYDTSHEFYCGIDLHARLLYLCVLDADGEKRFHRGIPASTEALLSAVRPYRDGLVIAAECTFTWYWLADLCAREGIPFVLGHALYMKAIHGGKAKNDRIDPDKIARLLRDGMFAYVYTREWRGLFRPVRRSTPMESARHPGAASRLGGRSRAPPW